MNPLQLAILELGKEEIPRGSNWGEHVEKYLAAVGIGFPASWCMAFVYWCVENSDIKNNLIKTGGVLKQWYEVNPIYKSSSPRIGDIFIIDYGRGLGHTGFVENVVGDTIYTVEGNTNDTGSREGYEVCRRQRKISDCKGFIHLSSQSQQLV